MKSGIKRTAVKKPKISRIQKISLKFLGWLLPLALVPLVLSAYLGYVNTREATVREVTDRLAAY